MQRVPDFDVVSALVAARVPRDLRGLRLANAGCDSTHEGTDTEIELDRAMARHIEVLERCQSRAALRLIEPDHAEPMQ